MANDKRTGELLEAAAKVIGEAMAESELVRTIPFGIIDPDYARIYTKARIIAWTYGYACCVHGTFTRDLDLVLVPWTDTAKQNIDQIVAHLASVCDLRINGEPSEKPNGRKAWTLLLPGFGECRWVDLSALAPVQEARGGRLEMESRTEIAVALRMLSVEMTRIAEAMQATGALTEMAQHGIELAGAGQIALQWAEAIEAERGE